MSLPLHYTSALLLDQHGRYLTQIRDEIPGILHPGALGLFGGAVEPGETANQAMRRELAEEIGFVPDDLAFWRSVWVPVTIGGARLRSARVDIFAGSIPAERVPGLDQQEGTGRMLIGPRRLLLVEEAGQAVGAAAVFLSEIATARGIDRVATLGPLFLPEPSADRLAAVMRAASEAFGGEATAPTVSAPNLAIVPQDQLRTAGVRATAATFDAFVVHPKGGSWLDAETTNLEVV